MITNCKMVTRATSFLLFLFLFSSETALHVAFLPQLGSGQTIQCRHGSNFMQTAFFVIHQGTVDFSVHLDSTLFLALIAEIL